MRYTDPMVPPARTQAGVGLPNSTPNQLRLQERESNSARAVLVGWWLVVGGWCVVGG